MPYNSRCNDNPCSCVAKRILVADAGCGFNSFGIAAKALNGSISVAVFIIVNEINCKELRTMLAKMRLTEFECYKKSFNITLRKEESRDAVVPDTYPDISDVLCCEAKLMIRSKDVSSGRVRSEINVCSNVIYKGEDGKIYSLELIMPAVFEAEDEAIEEQCFATAKLRLLKLEARALNPRKIIVRAEVEGELSVYCLSKLILNSDVEDEEHIKSKICTRQMSYVSAVMEKTFAVTDEILLPAAAEGAKNLTLSGCDYTVDDIKSVGTKLIIKGKTKCRIYYINNMGEICQNDCSSDYSQIIELGIESSQGMNSLWMIPSGAYCSYQEGENRVSLELHMVAQVVCRSTVPVEYIDDAYSNRYKLEQERKDIKIEYAEEPLRIRESSRLLFETSEQASNIIYSWLWTEPPIISASGMKIPLNLVYVCQNGDRIWSENRRAEVSLHLPVMENHYVINRTETQDWTIIPVPGGVELRLEVTGEVYAHYEDTVNCVYEIAYNEDEQLDNSAKPSLTLLRVHKDDDLWKLARDNCSSPDVILSVNGIEDLTSSDGKLILIPKTY